MMTHEREHSKTSAGDALGLLKELSGLEFLKAIAEGRAPMAPLARLLGFQPSEAEGNIIHLGRQTATAEGRITDSRDRLLAHATTTCLVFAIPWSRSVFRSLEIQMNSWMLGAAAVFGSLGGAHLVYAIRDFNGNPRYFGPEDPTLLDQMRRTHTAMAPHGRDYWSGILGFHLSHGIGILLFVVIILLAGQGQIAWLKPALPCIGALYGWISWRCWFRVPTIGCAAGTVLLTAGWLL
jgi:hypothetical protein